MCCGTPPQDHGNPTNASRHGTTGPDHWAFHAAQRVVPRSCGGAGATREMRMFVPHDAAAGGRQAGGGRPASTPVRSEHQCTWTRRLASLEPLLHSCTCWRVVMSSPSIILSPRFSLLQTVQSGAHVRWPRTVRRCRPSRHRAQSEVNVSAAFTLLRAWTTSASHGH